MLLKLTLQVWKNAPIPDFEYFKQSVDDVVVLDVLEAELLFVLCFNCFCWTVEERGAWGGAVFMATVSIVLYLNIKVGVEYIVFLIFIYNILCFQCILIVIFILYKFTASLVTCYNLRGFPFCTLVFGKKMFLV